MKTKKIIPLALICCAAFMARTTHGIHHSYLSNENVKLNCAGEKQCNSLRKIFQKSLSPEQITQISYCDPESFESRARGRLSLYRDCISFQINLGEVTIIRHPSELITLHYKDRGDDYGLRWGEAKIVIANIQISNFAPQFHAVPNSDRSGYFLVDTDIVKQMSSNKIPPAIRVEKITVSEDQLKTALTAAYLQKIDEYQQIERQERKKREAAASKEQELKAGEEYKRILGELNKQDGSKK